jgi:hypothetical protein
MRNMQRDSSSYALGFTLSYFLGAPGAPVAPAPAVAGFMSGTRNIVWQCWHFTNFPRTSSGTERIFRQRKFGQMS